VKLRKSQIDMSTASQLLAKASDDLNAAAELTPKERQRDNAGYHLSQAVEKILKFLLEISGVIYPRDGKNGHNIDFLIFLVSDNTKIALTDDHIDLAQLDVYGSGSRYDYVAEDERVDLVKVAKKCSSLYNLALREYGKIAAR